ncbi:hypothetical protein [Streptomyces sp. NPDC047315]|uniref:hypothetical protein n=1 Tax=Streptomyces sp. NPDC047315 TaxID=3155142 RepID=UPI0033E83A4E
MISGLPDGWVRTTLGELTQPSTVREIPGDADERPYLAMDGLEPHTGVVQSLTRAGDFRSSAPLVKPGYTLYGRLRPYLNKVTEASFDGLCSAEFIPLPSQPWLAPRFLMYRLMAPDFVRFTTRLNDGDRPRVKWEQISSFEINLPPLAEQYRIVTAVEDNFSRLEAVRGYARAAQLRADSLTWTLKSRAAQGRLGAKGKSLPEAVDSIRLIDDRANQKFDYKLLEPLPEGWKWRIAQDICTPITSGSTPASNLMYENEGDIPFLKVYNISPSGFIDFTIKPTFIDEDTHNGKLRRSRVRPGDVLTNIVGPPLGKSAVVPATFPEWNINQAITAFRAGPEILPSWLALLLRSPFILDKLKATAKATAGQFNIAVTTCRALPLPVPPLEVQAELVALAESSIDKSQRLADRVADVSQQSELLRRSILSAAVTGRLVPQDANDQPASALLEQMKARQMLNPQRRRARPKATASSNYVKEELPL